MAEQILAPPSDVRAEQEVLSTIFSNNESIYEIIGYLSHKDFHSTQHQIIYKTMLDMQMKDIPIDVVTLSSSLGKDKVQSVGGITYLAQLSNSGLRTTNIKTYADIVKTLSQKREIIQSCSEALREIHETDPQVVIDKLENKFMSFTSDREEEKTISLPELMEMTLNNVEENYKSGGKINGIPTGYRKLDNAINGLVKKDLVLIAARPSMGKTALTMNIIGNIPKEYNVMLFELEMSAEKIGYRLTAQQALLNATELSRGKLKENDFGVIAKKASIMADKNNFYLNCKSSMSIAQIRAEAKKIKIKYGLDVIFVDHIGKIRPDNPKASRNDQIGQISEGLKALAKDLDVCVVALSQLNRECEKGADKHPMLSHLRDSGNLEQDADTIMFLYRDDYYAEREDRDSKSPGTIEVMVAKNRDGEVGKLELYFKPEYQLVTELSSNSTRR